MLWIVITTLWLFLPAYTPNNFAVLLGGGKPLDLGKKFIDGKRIFGDGKTFRGFFAGFFGGIITGLIQYRIESFFGFKFFTSLNFNSAITLFLLLSTGSLAGDVTGSFIKRRIGLERGERAILLDQLDFLIAAILLSSLHEDFHRLYTPEIIVIAILITPILHVLTNFIAYLLRFKDVPW